MVELVGVPLMVLAAGPALFFWLRGGYVAAWVASVPLDLAALIGSGMMVFTEPNMDPISSVMTIPVTVLMAHCIAFVPHNIRADIVRKRVMRMSKISLAISSAR